MVHKLNKPDTTRWAFTFIPKHPWIPHSLLSKVYLVVVAFPAVVFNSTNCRRVGNSQEIKVLMLEVPICAYNTFMSSVEEAVAGDVVGCFGCSPSTFEGTLPLPPADIKKRLVKVGEELINTPVNKGNTYGWLVATDKSKKIPWPKEIHNICEKWAIKGEVCGDTSTCTLKHGRYRDIYQQDKVLSDKMVSDTPYLEFNPEAFPSGRSQSHQT